MIKLDVSMSQRLATSLSREIHRILIRSLYVSGKLPTYPSLKPTFCPKWEVNVNVGLGKLGHTNCFVEADGLLRSGHYVNVAAACSCFYRFCFLPCPPPPGNCMVSRLGSTGSSVTTTGWMPLSGLSRLSFGLGCSSWPHSLLVLLPPLHAHLLKRLNL